MCRKLSILWPIIVSKLMQNQITYESATAFANEAKIWPMLKRCRTLRNITRSVLSLEIRLWCSTEVHSAVQNLPQKFFAETQLQ